MHAERGDGDVVSSETIREYWDERARSYYNGVKAELADDRFEAWNHVIDRLTGNLLAHKQADIEDTDDQAKTGANACDRPEAESCSDADGQPEVGANTGNASREHAPRVLDLGCGPGFFSVLFAERGCLVDAVDASENMLERARANVGASRHPRNVTFHLGDVSSLPFPDGTFSLAISRNVTWLMRNPEAAYAEWLRVLKPGGKLLVFDANWYRYLVDPATNAARIADQTNNALEGFDEDTQATPDEAQRCEAMAATLPLTSAMRPQWDIELLAGMGVAEARCEKGIWKEVWTESEQAYYASSPLFLVEAVK